MHGCPVFDNRSDTKRTTRAHRSPRRPTACVPPRPVQWTVCERCRWCIRPVCGAVTHDSIAVKIPRHSLGDVARKRYRPSAITSHANTAGAIGGRRCSCRCRGAGILTGTVRVCAATSRHAVCRSCASVQRARRWRRSSSLQKSFSPVASSWPIMPAIPIIASRPLLISFVFMSKSSCGFRGFRPSGSKPRLPLS